MTTYHWWCSTGHQVTASSRDIETGEDESPCPAVWFGDTYCVGTIGSAYVDADEYDEVVAQREDWYDRWCSLFDEYDKLLLAYLDLKGERT